MKRASLIMAVLALATVAGALAPAQAATCATTPAGRTATDPFGSCENSSGVVTCGGAGTSVGGVFTLIVLNSSNTGVQGCADSSDLLPVKGRVSVYRDSANNVAVAADGDDVANSGGAAGWQRYDVRSSGAVCARRASGGSWWTAHGSTNSTSASNVSPDAGHVNQGINTSGSRTPCGGSPVPA